MPEQNMPSRSAARPHPGGSVGRDAERVAPPGGSRLGADECERIKQCRLVRTAMVAVLVVPLVGLWLGVFCSSRRPDIAIGRPSCRLGQQVRDPGLDR
jgi:hypothetical protein